MGLSLAKLGNRSSKSVLRQSASPVPSIVRLSSSTDTVWRDSERERSNKQNAYVRLSYLNALKPSLLHHPRLGLPNRASLYALDRRREGREQA